MAKISLIKPSDSDPVLLTDINSNWTAIENTFGNFPAGYNDVMSVIENGGLMFNNWAYNAANTWESAVNNIGTTAIATSAKTNMTDFLNKVDEVAAAMSNGEVSLKVITVSSSNAGLAAIYRKSSNVFVAFCVPLNNSFVYLARKLNSTSCNVRLIS